MRYIIVFILLISLLGCNQKNNIAGIYEGINFKNTIDTLYIYPHGGYRHSVFDKISGDSIIENVGKWSIDNGSIYFHDFKINNDRFQMTPRNPKIKSYQTAILPYKKNKQKIIYDSDRKLFYKKIN